MAQAVSITQIPPEGILRLYGGVEIGGGRQKIFKSKAEQKAYFDNHLVMSFNDMSYIRMGEGIQIETDTITISNCNYLSFINKTSGVETEIYAQINPNWEYVNPNTVRIGYAVDWWQTCMHADMTMREGLVRREHMCENDWTAATANPYADIFQLQTSEDLVMDQSMERLGDPDHGDVYVFPELTHNDPHETSTDVVSPEDMRIMLVLGQSDFSNTEDVPPDSDSYIPQISYSLIRHMIYTSGGMILDKATNFGFIQGIPSPCTIFVLKYTTDDTLSLNSFTYLLRWIEYNGITGNVVGLYWIPKIYAEMTTDHIRYSMTPKPYNYTPRNPKLYRAPYCYLRVSDETGQFKHYEWENFVPLVNDSLNLVQLDMFVSKLGMPTFLVAPKQYKTRIVSTSSDNEAALTNMDEAFVHDDIPTIPFSTDGYLSALGSKMREAWASTGIQGGIKQVAAGQINRIDSMSDVSVNSYPIQSSMSGGVFDPNAAMSVALTQTMQQASRYELKDIITAINKAPLKHLANFAAGISDNLQKATVADNYKQGSTKGWAGYMRAPLRFIFQKVCPRADIVEQYDKYLDYFGYSSGRIGLPYVYNYIKQTGDQPHFATLDSGEQVTYCQADISVFTNGKAPDIAARAIEAMFSAGVLFTK